MGSFLHVSSEVIGDVRAGWGEEYPCFASLEWHSLNKGRADLDGTPLRLLARGGGHFACENEWPRDAVWYWRGC
jgi:hypothetical protein